MFGWFSDASVWASRVNRTSRSASLAKRSGSTLIATSRLSLVSRARYTSPMPPAPIGATISYGPRRVPAARGMELQIERKALIVLAGDLSVTGKRRGDRPLPNGPRRLQGPPADQRPAERDEALV